MSRKILDNIVGLMPSSVASSERRSGRLRTIVARTLRGQGGKLPSARTMRRVRPRYQSYFPQSFGGLRSGSGGFSLNEVEAM